MSKFVKQTKVIENKMVETNDRIEKENKNDLLWTKIGLSSILLILELLLFNITPWRIINQSLIKKILILGQLLFNAISIMNYIIKTELGFSIMVYIKAILSNGSKH